MLSSTGRPPSRLHRPAAWAIWSSPASARQTRGKSRSTPASTSEVAIRRQGFPVREPLPNVAENPQSVRRILARRQMHDAVKAGLDRFAVERQAHARGC